MKAFIGLLLLVAAIAFGVSWYSSSISCRCCAMRSSPKECGQVWLNKELGLDEAQQKLVAPIESAYAQRRAAQAAELREANRQLGRVLSEDKAFTPRVAAAVEQVHKVQGEMQKSALEHLFQLRAVLRPPQADKLLMIAGEGLERCH